MLHRVTDNHNAQKLPIPQDAWLLHRSEELEVIRLHLAPGDRMDNHVNEWHIIFFVLRGEGLLNVEGRTSRLAEQQSIAVEAGKERFWTNEGAGELQLLVIKNRKDTA